MAYIVITRMNECSRLIDTAVMYVCMFVCVCVCLRECMFICTHRSTPTHTHLFTNLFLSFSTPPPPPVPLPLNFYTHRLFECLVIKLQVSFAEYRLFYRALLQKRPWNFYTHRLLECLRHLNELRSGLVCLVSQWLWLKVRSGLVCLQSQYKIETLTQSQKWPCVSSESL